MGSDLSTPAGAAGASNTNAGTDATQHERASSTTTFDWLIGGSTAPAERGASKPTSSSETPSRRTQNGGIRKGETEFDKVRDHRLGQRWGWGGDWAVVGRRHRSIAEMASMEEEEVGASTPRTVRRRRLPIAAASPGRIDWAGARDRPGTPRWANLGDWVRRGQRPFEPPTKISLRHHRHIYTQLRCCASTGSRSSQRSPRNPRSQPRSLT